MAEIDISLLDRIHLGDNLAFMRSLPDCSIDLTLCSPPYDQVRDYKGFTWNFEGLAHELYRVLKKGGVLVWVVADGTINGEESFTSLEQALYFKKVVGFRAHDTMIFAEDGGTVFPDPTRYNQSWEYMFVFSKGKPKTINLQTRPNRWAGDKRRPDSIVSHVEKDGSRSPRKRKEVKEEGVYPNLWTIGVGYGKSTKWQDAFNHPAIFPETLAERHILSWTNEGDIVFDPFMGSGTTAIMARKHNRRWLGAEIAQEYIDLAERRLRETDPMQNQLLDDGTTQLSLFA